MSEDRPAEEENRDETGGATKTHIGLDDGLVKEVRNALAEENATLIAALAAPLHPADLADLLQLFGAEARESIVAALGPAFDPDTLPYLDDGVREELFEKLDPEDASKFISELETDDAIDVLIDLDDEQKDAILASLPHPDRAVLEQGLSYPEDSAGRLMQRDTVMVPDYWVVGQTIDYLRATPDLPDEFYDIYIIDAQFRPVGSVPLSNILRSKRSVPMSNLKMKALHRVPATMDQEEVAFLFRQYGLVSAPVVDESDRLLGVITIDDAVDVMHEEAEEDILKLGGVSETDTFRSPIRTMTQRLPWLMINLLTAIIASMVIARFDEAISRVVALAILMPIVASMGGNAGTQTLTVTVRSLAVRELTASNAWRMLTKEFLVSVMNGTIFVLIGFAIAFIWFGDLTLAWVFSVAMLINLMAAGLAGIAIPLAIDRFGSDPAVSSGVFLTTVTDVVGFLSFLGLAVYVLN
ncbi:MAG: magnesium transporter [Geminicoccaceae bacterium]|nr:magnesium transporter [Geminicoccaceae bacterium]